MNALQASMTTHNPEARAMFWGDMLSPYHNGARPGYQLMSGGVYGATTGATALLNKRVQLIPWWYSPYSTKISTEWPANCSAPVPAKDCERNCINFRCGMTQSPVFFGDTYGLDWLAGAGTGALSKEVVPGWPIGSTNQAEWAATEKLGDVHALGIMTTQWHGGGEAPDTTGLSPTADFGWNRRHTRRTSDCATAVLKSDDTALHSVQLAADGKALATIVVPAARNRSAWWGRSTTCNGVQQAAEELSYYISQMAGTRPLHIVSDPRADGQSQAISTPNVIFVGQVDWALEIAGLDTNSLGPEGGTTFAYNVSNFRPRCVKSTMQPK